MALCRLDACALAATLTVSCMPPPGSDESWPLPAGWNTPGYAWPPDVRSAPEPAAPASRPLRVEPLSSGPSRARPEPAAPAPSIGSTLPESTEACLKSLTELKVSFERQEEVRGVEVPVILKGSVGGVEYWATDRRPLLLDCRLGLALHAIGPLLVHQGVTRVRFSGAYVYRNTRGGRLSLHAGGLAIDVHDFVVGGETLSVKQHFSRGAGCEGNVPVLNRIACGLEETGLFRELLTPDSNRDHHDHLHLGVARRALPAATQSVARADAP